MTFDPNLPHKNIDGVDINLTKQEIADIAAMAAAYVPPPPPIPDLATQLASLLIDKNIITKDDINSKTLISINDSLMAANQEVIK